MKINVQSDELTRALYRVQGIADKKSTMPALAHVLIHAKDSGELLVHATDMDLSLSGNYQCTVEEPGRAVLHARQLYDIVKTLKNESVHLQTTENHWVELHAGTGKFRLVGMVPDEYPRIEDIEDISTFLIGAKDLTRLIDRTLFCVSTDDNRHNLSGVYCEAHAEHGLRMVATDGHRLAMADLNLPAGQTVPFEEGVIVPRKAFQELKRIVGNSEAEIESLQVEMGFAHGRGVMRVGQVELRTSLVEGSFPQYEQVVPTQGDKLVRMDKASLAGALRRVSLLSQSRSHGVRLELSAGTLDLVAEDPEVGTARESLPVAYDGADLVIGFNARYILDVLALIPNDGVTLSLSDDLSPGVIQPLQEEKAEGGFLAVVMPMRI